MTLKTTSLMMLTLGLSLNAAAQTTLPYTTGFDDNAQKTGWQQYRKGVIDPFYEWTYNAAGGHTAPNCLVHNYPVGGTAASDDWFVSPPFALPGGGKIDSLYCSFSGFGVPGAADTVAIYLLTGAQDPALATAKTMLYDYRDAKYSADNTWRNTTGITIPNTPGSCYIAIRYKTVSNWLDVKFDNIKIRSNATTGISGKEAGQAELTAYPNPAGNTLHFKTTASFTTIRLYDISGKMLLTTPFSVSTDIASLPAGTYIAECLNKEGDKARTTFLKK